MFTIINNSHCILNCAGVYKQTELYTYAGFVHAKVAGGYVRLYKESFGTRSTSHARTSWVEVGVPEGVVYHTVTQAMQEAR